MATVKLGPHWKRTRTAPGLPRDRTGVQTVQGPQRDRSRTLQIGCRGFAPTGVYDFPRDLPWGYPGGGLEVPLEPPRGDSPRDTWEDTPGTTTAPTSDDPPTVHPGDPPGAGLRLFGDLGICGGQEYASLRYLASGT